MPRPDADKSQVMSWPDVTHTINVEFDTNLSESHVRALGARALNKLLKVFMVDPELRELIQEWLPPSEFAAFAEMHPDTVENALDEFKESVNG